MIRTDLGTGDVGDHVNLVRLLERRSLGVEVVAEEEDGD